MKIEEVVQECKRIKIGLGEDFAFKSLMRDTYGMNFVTSEVIDRIFGMDETVDEDKIITYILADHATRSKTSLCYADRLSVLLRLYGVEVFLPQLDIGKGGLELPFRTRESAISWALTRFWSVAIYGTVDSAVRSYEDETFDRRHDLSD